MDFRYLILGQKLKIQRENSDSKYMFDDFQLAEILDKSTEHTQLFTKSSIQKIIDYQFEKSGPRFKRTFMIYVFLYYIPFLVTIFIPYRIAEMVIHIVSLITMCFFFGVELIQMKFAGWQYFKEFWNIVELAQFVLFIVYFVIRSSKNFIEPSNLKDSLSEISIQFFLVIFGFFKCLYFIRIFPSFGFLVSMVGETLKQFGPFIIFLAAWIVFFGLCYMDTQVEIQNADSDYLHLWEIIQYFLMTYRNTIGDVTTPSYVEWNTRFNEDVSAERSAKHLIIILIWVIWIFNQLFNLIMLLNFLIAVISQVYDDVVGRQETLSYIHKA